MGQKIEKDTLNEAIPLYIGVGALPYPKEDEARLFEHFGDEAGSAVLEAVRAIVTELQTIEPDWEKHTLVSGSKWAVEKLRSKYDDLDDKSGSALEWLYSWWWK